MYSMIRHPKFPFLLLLFISVAASNAFVPRRHRRYKTEASSRPSIVDSSQSVHHRDAILPFGLNIRGGDLAEKVVTSEAAKNDEEAIEEAADSDEIATRVWEEEIKRTRSFYQEQSVNNDDDIGEEQPRKQNKKKRMRKKRMRKKAKKRRRYSQGSEVG